LTRVFVTGATGFIGRSLTRKLLARDHEVTFLTRHPDGQATRALQAAGAVPVHGDITEAETMHEAMAEAELVFHLAGWYRVGEPDPATALSINVEGTRTVLESAYGLGVPNIVYTSTGVVLGNTRGRIVDERFCRQAPFASIYARSKTIAHEIAQELIHRGAPVRIVMPGAVFGPQDHSLVGTFLRFYLRGWLPLIPGVDAGISLTYVDDVAEGHILAAERGHAGESYLLAGPCLTYEEMLRLVARVADRPEPISMSSWPVPGLVQLARLVNRFVSLPPAFHPETLGYLNGLTYWFNAGKAQHELGWRRRPLITGVQETVAWELEQLARS
jgi:dihydroflavonol-4-reductase